MAKMITVKMKQSIHGAGHVGSVVEVEEKWGKALITQGRAEAYEEPAAEGEEPATEQKSEEKSEEKSDAKVAIDADEAKMVADNDEIGQLS